MTDCLHVLEYDALGNRYVCARCGLPLTTDAAMPRTAFNSADLHLRLDGHWPPRDDRPTMRPDELED